MRPPDRADHTSHLGRVANAALFNWNFILNESFLNVHAVTEMDYATCRFSVKSNWK